MQEKHDKQSQQDQRDPRESTNNPEKLAVSDEAQRTTAKESGERPKATPTGSEREDQTNTEGAQAGMGE
ncbi:MAG TPA: hypothetical protein VD993_15900 [Chitinophagaceae bacterium]|nr:hypothetical protein [Chitinophagaceae bacterium]